MTKTDSLNYTPYDCDKNPAGFSLEEITTIRRLMAAGRKVFFAPVEIELWEQTENLFITRDKVRLWRVGSEPVKVYLTPCDEASYRFLVNELRKKHRDGVRACRCTVTGKRGKPIRCDERNSCAACPYGRSPEDRELREISWDGLEGFEPASHDTTMDEALTRLGRQALIEKLESVDPRLATVYKMQDDGRSIPEIMAKLNLSQRRVYDLIKQVKTIAAGVLE